jgi:hypothetical protein
MRGIGCLLLVALMTGVLGCSPEAQRTRSGGAGADVGNRGATVQLHGAVQPEQSMFYRTPLKEVSPPGVGRTP